MISIKNLVKKYNTTVVLENASFNFPKNGLVCILGPSGCGKTTLLNILAGFDSDYNGEVQVCGTSISKMSSEELCGYRRDNIGFVFQDYHLLRGYTVLENIMVSSSLNTLSEEENTKNAKELLNKLDISNKIHEKIENLSGGQKQRVAIARALTYEPNIILADEPTGALDRNNSTEIMKLLKEISQERLVVVITHDSKVCDFADEVITIEEGKLKSNKSALEESYQGEAKLSAKPVGKVSAFKRGLKNFKVHISRYTAVSLAISFGILAFMLSLSSGNIMEKSIKDFKDKNTAFNNGYVKGEDDGTILELLKADEGIENIYYQYKLRDISLASNDKSEVMVEKYPMPKSTESFSYGVMPRKGSNEIALSPSLAKKFKSDISTLIGEEMVLTYEGKEYKLSISGIFNASYDDFFISSDIEEKLYENIKGEKNYSISYDVKAFEDIVEVSEMLKAKGIDSQNFAKEVEALQTTFKSLSRLFLIVAILILGIGLFISTILLVKLQKSRYRELGLLAALGFDKGTIRKIIVYENILLSVMAAMFNGVMIGGMYLLGSVLKLNLIITPLQMILSIISTGISVIIISLMASQKLINTEPALALKK